MASPPADAGESAMAAVSAIVVNYNARPLLGACLASLRAAAVEEIVVVDNGSTDGSAEEVAAADPAAVWLPAGGNLGYGRAANLGRTRCHGRHILVCNPDLEVAPDAVAALVARLEGEPDLGVVGPRLVNPDRTVYPSAREFPDLVDAVGHGLLGMLWPSNRWSSRYKLLDWDHSEARRVDWVSGACLLIRRSVWDQLGGFNPRYFMYLEDVDLCWRAGRAGWAVAYEPAAEVMHVQGVSAGRHPYRMILAHHASMWRFARQSTSGARRLSLPVVAAGLAGRAAFSCVFHRLGRQAVQQTVTAADGAPAPAGRSGQTAAVE